MHVKTRFVLLKVTFAKLVWNYSVESYLRMLSLGVFSKHLITVPTVPNKMQGIKAFLPLTIVDWKILSTYPIYIFPTFSNDCFFFCSHSSYILKIRLVKTLALIKVTCCIQAPKPRWITAAYWPFPKTVKSLIPWDWQEWIQHLHVPSEKIHLKSNTQTVWKPI